MNSVENINDWFNKAVPEPTSKNISTQIGAHCEEFAEFLECLRVKNNPLLEVALTMVTKAMHNLGKAAMESDVLEIPEDKRELALDALCDGIVTGVGVANYEKMDIISAVEEVNKSNWSKFDENGDPIFNENQKIIKGPNYFKPSLTSFI